MDLDKLAQELGGKPVSDLDALAAELGGEVASTPGGYGPGTFGKDVGKLVGAGAVKGITGAPETVQAAGSAAARETLFKPTEVLNLVADPRRLANKLVGSVGLPPIFETTKEQPLVPAQVTKEQRAAVDQTLARGKIPQLRQLTEYGNKLSEEIEESISPEMKLAMAESQPTGNIIKALETGDFSEVSMGKNPTALGLTGQAVKVFGSSAPQFIVGMVTKTPTLGAAVGFGQAGAEGIDEARNYIKGMSDEELTKKSEYFRNLIALGYSTNQARQMTEDKAADTAAMAQGTVGALGGAFTSKLLQGGFDKTLLGNVKSRLGKVLQGAGIAGAEGAITELAEGVATDLSIDKTVVREIGVDSFANLVLGAIGEAAPGVVRGALAKGEPVKGAEAPEVPPAPVTPVTPPAGAPPAIIPEGGFETEEEAAAPAVTPPAAKAPPTTPPVTPPAPPAAAPEAVSEETTKRIAELDAEFKQIDEAYATAKPAEFAKLNERQGQIKAEIAALQSGAPVTAVTPTPTPTEEAKPKEETIAEARAKPKETLNEFLARATPEELAEFSRKNRALDMSDEGRRLRAEAKEEVIAPTPEEMAPKATEVVTEIPTDIVGLKEYSAPDYELPTRSSAKNIPSLGRDAVLDSTNPEVIKNVSDILKDYEVESGQSVEGNYIGAVDKDIRSKEEEIKSPTISKKSVIPAAEIRVAPYDGGFLASSSYMGKTGGYSSPTSIFGDLYKTRQEAIDAEANRIRKQAQEDKNTVALKWLDTVSKPTKEGQVEINKVRQAEKKAAAAKAKGPVDTSAVKDLIPGKIKKFQGYTIYKRQEDPDLWYVQSPDNKALNRIGQGDEVSTNLDTARSKVELYVMEEEEAGKPAVPFKSALEAKVEKITKPIKAKPAEEAKEEEISEEDMKRLERLVELGRIAERPNVTMERAIAAYKKAADKQGALDTTEKNLENEAKDKLFNAAALQYSSQIGRAPKNENQLVNAIKNGSVSIANTSYEKDFYDVYKIKPKAAPKVEGVSTDVAGQINKFNAGNFSDADVNPEIYKKAAVKFLESPLTAKIPSKNDTKIEAKELSDVNPLPIPKKFGKTISNYVDQKKALMEFAAKNDIRFYLNGIHLNKPKKRMEVTNGHRLAIINDANFTGEPNPAAKTYVVDKDNKILDIQGQYPDIDRVLPKKHVASKTTVNMQDLGNSARGIQKAWRYIASKYNPMIFDVNGKKIGLNSDYIVDMTDLFQKLGYKDAVMSIDSDGRLYATSTDGKVEQVVMSMRDAQSPFVAYKLKAKGKKVEEEKTIDVKAVDITPRQVRLLTNQYNKLSDADIATLEEHYGIPNYSDDFFKRIREDVVNYINKGADAVDAAIRSIIAKLQAGLLSVAVVFNPGAFQTPDFDVPRFIEETKTVTAQVPKNADMSEISNQAYSITAPAFIKAKQAFFIADKPNGKIHLFDTDGKFLKSSDALYGKQAGDVLSEQIRTMKISEMKDVDKITPAGMYTLSVNPNPDYTGGYTLRFNDNKGDLGGIAIHAVYTGNVMEKREAKLASKDPKDKKVSFGCINVDTSFFTGNIIPRIKQMENAGVVVIPDAQERLAMFVKPTLEKVTVPAKEIKESDRAKMVARETPYYNDFTSNLDESYFDKQIVKSRDDKISDYAQARAKTRRITKEVAKYGSDIPLQKELNRMLEIEQELKDYLDATKPVRNTAEDFMARAAKELADGNISPEVEGFIRNTFEKNPAILEGLLLSVRGRKGEGRDSGNFNPYTRLVTLWKDGSGVDNAKTIRHELTHSLEQMMRPETKKVLVEQWARAFEQAMKKHTDKASKAYFDAVLDFLENPSKENFDKATKVMPSYDFYQYINPSEYWAVNAEAMLGAKLGGAWSRFTNAVKKLLEGLKSFFGMNNKYAVHKAMDEILSGDMNRINKETLVDYLLQGKYKIDYLNNVEETDALLDKHSRPVPPIHPSNPVKDAFMGGYSKSKKTVENVLTEPRLATSNMIGRADRAITEQRNKNIFYGTGLELADRERYGGQVRNGHKQAIASVALVNAIHSGHIASQVMTQGKLIFNQDTQMFQADKSDKSMANVVRAKAKLVEKLGDVRAAKVIQAFFEAKRSRSIINEYLDRTAAYEAALDSGESVADASRNLKNIEIAMQKIQMTDEAIDDFIKLDEKYPELKEMMDNWTSVNQNMIDMMEFSGLISKQRAKTLRGIKDYVPWYRIMDDMEDVHSAPGGTRGMTNVSREKKFKSGEVDRDIDDIVDNMIHNVLTLTRNSMRNYAANRIVMEYGTRNEKGKIKVFPSEGADKDGVRFNIVAAGKRIVVQIKDPLVAEAVIGMENIDIPMINALAYLANGLRRSITTFPAFQVAQLFMDAPTAALVTGLKNPAKVWATVFTSFLKNLRKDDPIVAKLRSYGIGGYQSSARTPEKEIQMDIGLIQGSWFSKAMKGLDRFGDASDYAQRRAVYMQTLKETGDELLAIFQANNVIDFQKRGSGQVAQAVTRTVAFMNAYAQSIDVLAKGIAGGGIKGLSRKQAFARMFATGMLLSASTIVYCMLVGDDDEYNKLDDQTKMRNIYIPGLDMRLPMHTGASFFFKAVPELIYNKIMKEGTKDEYDKKRLTRALGKAALDSLLGPNITPTGVKPVVEIVLNKNFFTGGQVTPKGMEDLAAFRQYNQNTSELGKIISALTGTEKTRLLNPMEADHLVRGLLGTAGAAVMWGSNMLIGNRADPQAKDNPFYGQFIMPDVARGREDLYYDLKSKTDEAYKTHQDLLKKGRKEEAAEWFKENKDLIRVYGYTSSVESNLKELNGEIRRIGDLPEGKMDSKQKRERINELQQIKMRVLRDVISMRKRAGLDESYF